MLDVIVESYRLTGERFLENPFLLGLSVLLLFVGRCLGRYFPITGPQILAATFLHGWQGTKRKQFYRVISMFVLVMLGLNFILTGQVPGSATHTIILRRGVLVLLALLVILVRRTYLKPAAVIGGQPDS